MWSQNVRSVLHESDKHYIKVFLNDCLYKFINYKCYIMIKLTLLKELVLTREVHQNKVIFVTIGVS